MEEVLSQIGIYHLYLYWLAPVVILIVPFYNAYTDPYSDDVNALLLSLIALPFLPYMLLFLVSKRLGKALRRRKIRKDEKNKEQQRMLTVLLSTADTKKRLEEELEYIYETYEIDPKLIKKELAKKQNDIDMKAVLWDGYKVTFKDTKVPQESADKNTRRFLGNNS